MSLVALHPRAYGERSHLALTLRLLIWMLWAQARGLERRSFGHSIDFNRSVRHTCTTNLSENILISSCVYVYLYSWTCGSIKKHV